MNKAIFLILCLSPFWANADQTYQWQVDVPAMQASYTQANGINVAYKSIGNPENPTVLLIMGLGGSHRLWGNDLPNRLLEAGYRVVVFDNRDVGDSQRFDEAGNPIMWWEGLKWQLGFDVNAAYDLGDMASDSVGLMDALGVEQAHVVGASMGGMIAQVVAARHPERVLSLTSIMSTPGFADHLPPPGELPITEADIDEPEDERKARLETFGLYLDAIPRQIMAILKSGDRTEEVRSINVPTLVLHGQEDTLITPEHGAYTAELIEGSDYIVFENMGHNLPPEVMPALVGAMVEHMDEVVLTPGV
jgi:pimeloyl-ACP methyl ester carboxylesterase